MKACETLGRNQEFILFCFVLHHELFMAEGEGLPSGVVENMSSRVKQIVDLYRLDVSSRSSSRLMDLINVEGYTRKSHFPIGKGFPIKKGVPIGKPSQSGKYLQTIDHG